VTPAIYIIPLREINKMYICVRRALICRPPRSAQCAAAIGQQPTMQYNTRTVQTQINKARAPVGLVFWKPACFLLLVKLPLFSFYSALNSSHAVAPVPKTVS
jgi:hypothetical protein